MAQCKEKGRKNMSVFQAVSTPQWAILAKSLGDAQMASISNRKPLAQATSLRGAPFGPTFSPFERLGGVVYEFTA